ncbi:MAG: alpha/beta hydrolase [Alphaproteobacteria bacterium]
MANPPDPEHIDVGAGAAARKIAVCRRPAPARKEPQAPGLFWLGGFKSDMEGSKAVALDQFAAKTGRACTRFDYSGHGRSGGSFTAGTISRWLEEAIAALDRCTAGPQIIVGSSMGGWIALLLATHLNEAGRSDKLAGLVLIAPAIDMTKDLMWDLFDADARAALKRDGEYRQPSDYSDEPYILTRALIEDGEKHLFGDRLIEIGCPVHVLQGMQDTDVPWRHGAGVLERLAHDDAVLTLVRDGDHRLSRPQDIDRLLAIIAGFPVPDAAQDP